MVKKKATKAATKAAAAEVPAADLKSTRQRKKKDDSE